MNYLEIIKWATLAFPLVAFLFTLPFVLFQYHKLGSISFYKSVVVYLFIYYLICAYFLVILPLPKISEVALLRTPRVQLIPFDFIIDFVTHVSFDINNIGAIFRESYFYVPVFNIILTMPFGFFLCYYYEASWKDVVKFSFILSLFFELTQLSGLYFVYPRGYRLFDVDDLILNTLGGLCGYILCGPFSKILPSISLVNDDAKEKGKIVSGFRRYVTFCLDLFIVLIIDLLVIVFIGDYFYLNLFIIFIYYFIVPLFLGASTIGERFLNIMVVDYKDEVSYFRLFFRRILFIIIYMGIPFGIFSLILNLNDSIYREFIGIILFGIYALICMISFIKYLFTNKDMIYEKISKTRLASTIK